MGPFIRQFRSVVEPLFAREFDGADGYSDPELDDAETQGGYELPEALRDFYMLVGRFVPVMDSHNHFHTPYGLSRMDDKLVFCDENQAVVYWGYDEDQGWRTDPPIYQGVNNEELEWYVETDHFSHFLIGMIYWQALWGGLPHLRSAEAPDGIREVRAGYPLVWQDDDSQMFSRGACVYCFIRDGGAVRLDAAGVVEDELEEIGRVLGIQWHGA